MNQSIVSHKHLDPGFLGALEDLAASSELPNWWRDVLLNDELLIAVRHNYLNVYYRGASIFKIECKDGVVVPLTHAKYLLRNEQSYVPLLKGRFPFRSSPMWERYTGKETLREMMTAASAFAGREKTGLHRFLVNDRGVIDAEIALTRADEAEESSEDATLAPRRRQDRLDAAVAHQVFGKPTVTFHEAKHFENSDLRASGDNPAAVIGQMENYERAITAHTTFLAAGYVEVARALVRIAGMRKVVRGGDEGQSPDEAILQIAEGVTPVIDPKPHLLIFGFDKAQRDDASWVKHLRKLNVGLDKRVRGVGKANRKTAGFRH